MPTRPAVDTLTYRERWTVPWWGWVGAVAVCLLLAAEIHLGYSGVRSWLPYVVLVPLAVVSVGALSRITVSVDDDELRVDDAHIPRRFLLAAEALDAEARREALGPELDPVAFVVHRPWVRGTVRVYLDDPDDPTPYWIFSSRRPEKLLAALDLPLPAPEEAA
ncbi:DUF3093 domain-containing protein [Cryptosporangium phraense]|uniref:DUF3093 domain-containing protein n=1 Tax=Cryptosporangium phraense TaxID=2593070 RepID=A0A545AIY1_9ACTN|nr:DUF3093 domain-containing protein [Cryptosporangium phraense]TQS41282.1 DUF3093 domain-containing protein [Cryptosporangium phraense]